VATLVLNLTASSAAFAQNDWQFPDPYFGAIEFDASRPAAQRPQRVTPAPSPRPKTTRQRPYRSRQRWSQQGVRP
jgi:hypothetical protein